MLLSDKMINNVAKIVTYFQSSKKYICIFPFMRNYYLLAGQ